jgi:hypothetical protein
MQTLQGVIIKGLAALAISYGSMCGVCRAEMSPQEPPQKSNGLSPTINEGINQLQVQINVRDKNPLEIAKKISRDIEQGNYENASGDMFTLIAYSKYDAYRTGRVGTLWEGGLVRYLLMEECIPPKLRSNEKIPPSMPLESFLPLSLVEPQRSEMLIHIRNLENNPNKLLRLLQSKGAPTYDTGYMDTEKNGNLQEREPLDEDIAWQEVLGEYWREYE